MPSAPQSSTEGPTLPAVVSGADAFQGYGGVGAGVGLGVGRGAAQDGDGGDRGGAQLGQRQSGIVARTADAPTAVSANTVSS